MARIRTWIVTWIERLRHGGPWTELTADPGHRPEETIAVFHHLQRNGIRARYRVVGIGGGPGTPIGSVGQTISLIVHRDDIHRARELLDSTRRG